MRRNTRPDIDCSKCNAYSLIAHMYAAIRVDRRPASTSDVEGGIIVLPQEADAALADIKRIAQKHDPAGLTVGRFFKGRYTDKDGSVYSEGSLSVEVTGVSDEALMETGEELCRILKQKSALLKLYSERNRIIVVS